MKSKPKSKRVRSHLNDRLQRRTLRALRLAIFLWLLAGIFHACQARTAGQPVEWVDISEATAPGRLVVLNHSEQSLTRLWFSPSDVDGLWPGAVPESFQTIKPGNVFEDDIPAGWWDVWFEASNGADVLLYRTWFGDREETVFEITESWWELGDWIERTDENENSIAPE